MEKATCRLKIALEKWVWFIRRNTELLVLHMSVRHTEIMIGCQQEGQFKLKQVQKCRKGTRRATLLGDK